MPKVALFKMDRIVTETGNYSDDYYSSDVVHDVAKFVEFTDMSDEDYRCLLLWPGIKQYRVLVYVEDQADLLANGIKAGMARIKKQQAEEAARMEAHRLQEQQRQAKSAERKKARELKQLQRLEAKYKTPT